MRAYRIARAVTGAAARWDAVEKLEGVEPEIQAELMAGVDAVVDSATRWYLSWEPEGDLATVIAAGRDGVERLAEALPGLGTEERRTRRAGRPWTGSWARASRPRSPRAHALSAELEHAPDMVAVAAATGRELDDVAKVFFAVGAELRLDWLETQLDRAARRARGCSAGRCSPSARTPPRPAASSPRPRSTKPAAARRPRPSRRFLHTRDAATRRFAAFLRALSREGEPDLAGLTLAVRQLRALADSSS